MRLRPRWVRIPLGEIERVVIAPYSGGRSRTIALVVILFGVVVGAHVLNQAWWVALLFGSLILYWGYVSIKSLRGRTEIIVKRGKTSFVFRSPEDPYADEKQHDRKFLLELGSVLQQIGVEVENRGAMSAQL